MKVKQLMEILSKVDPEADVFYFDDVSTLGRRYWEDLEFVEVEDFDEDGQAVYLS